MPIPIWTLLGGSAVGAGMWGALIYGGIKAWEQPVIRTGIKLAFRNYIPG